MTRRDAQREIGWTARGFLCAAAFGFLLQGCTMTVSSGPDTEPVIGEVEPNDGACCAQFVAVLAPYTSVELAGYVTADGPDQFDGFAFVADQPCEVQIALVAEDPFADLDVCVFDPQLGDFTYCLQTVLNPEVGSFPIFFAQQEFHLVVTSAFSASAYRLQVAVRPLSATAAYAPGAGRSADPARAAHLDGYLCPAAVIAAAPRTLVRGVLIETEGDVVRARTVSVRSDGVLIVQ